NPFFYKTTPPTAISPLSLHDALPISFVPELEETFELSRKAGADAIFDECRGANHALRARVPYGAPCREHGLGEVRRNRALHLPRSEEHTSELQSLAYLVCRLLLEKKK